MRHGHGTDKICYGGRQWHYSANQSAKRWAYVMIIKQLVYRVLSYVYPDSFSASTHSDNIHDHICIYYLFYAQMTLPQKSSSNDFIA